MTTSPSSCAVEMRRSSRVTSVATGAGAPTLRSSARASRESQPATPHTLHAHARCSTVRRVKRRGSGLHRMSERVTSPDGGGPAWKQLVPVEMTVHGHLREAEDVQVLHDAQRDARTQIHHG